MAEILRTPSKLERKIHRACRANEPDLALNFEIADLVNEKQGSYPREASITVVKLINSKDPFVAVNALSLLDVLVKNCGYPFHLQISRKEFLNALVKRFPERPPSRYSKPQRVILSYIEEWTQTLCKNSKYKDDLGFIRDMHRLLAYKGYIFPEIKDQDFAVLNPSDNLKSIAEIQKEERIAMSAKLQELIRRGKPSDLKEANKLMKIMSGFQDDDSLVSSKQKVAEDLQKLKTKAEILNDMLTNFQSTSNNDHSNSSLETMNELFNSLKVAQPKITKLIEEESSDEEAVSRLIQLNDTFNSLTTKFELIMKNDFESASKININTSNNNNVQNLIDFGDDDDNKDNNNTNTNTNTNTNINPQQSQNNDLLDLLGDLNLNDNNQPSTSISNTQNSLNDLFNQSGSVHLSMTPQTTSNNQFQQQQPRTSAFDSLKQLQTLDILSQKPLNQGNQLSFQLQKQQTAQNNLFDLLSTPSTTTQTSYSNSNSDSIISQEINPSVKITAHKSENLKIDYEVFRQNDNLIKVNVLFSNLSLFSQINNLTNLIAVPKSLKLDLNPQSNNFMKPSQDNGITQIFTVTNVKPNSPVKIKWKCNYIINGQSIEESGVNTLPLI
ncbi:VHS-domain-containing protein [Ascoidea rubescens DSM 1968]|uniref:VHS-domain-containing protein n=1 Tax=Ascoidea rubescens DSM 1968 TaxID=1344418 RepID=A0A1D2VKY1_9ASCO|nr:VHS-domain-containing protein [Ascoidea rubescens DSM 1968]ODV62261.1 VHS-domain-containing protein [Ascoidea rubescens DSM 1968]